MAIQDFTTGQVLTAAQMDNLQANDYNQTVSAKVASYVLVAADKGTRITMSNAGATTITVNTSLFAAGDTLEITNIGAGASTITAGTATVSTASTLVLAQYDSGRLYFTSTGVAIWEKYAGAGATEGSWTNYTPTITAEIGTATSVTTIAGRYQMINSKTCLVQATWRVVTVGTASGLAIFTLPFTSKASNFIAVGTARETESSGDIGHVTVTSNIATGKTAKYNNTTFWVNAYTVNVQVIYEVA